MKKTNEEILIENGVDSSNPQFNQILSAMDALAEQTVEECLSDEKLQQSLQDFAEQSVANFLGEAFDAGKYLGFAQAHNRPGDYDSFDTWIEHRSKNEEE